VGEIKIWREGNIKKQNMHRVTYVISRTKLSSFCGAPRWSNTGIETPHIKQEIEL